ncbi:MAG: hypothetical protein O2819_06210 [Planctomycetota bacterium]|nr:hypothetical protein [Planctomycetota bacterium]MDA1105162.1 hypothetical protein [Planctomycetota bacterium]
MTDRAVRARVASRRWVVCMGLSAQALVATSCFARAVVPSAVVVQWLAWCPPVVLVFAALVGLAPRHRWFRMTGLLSLMAALWIAWTTALAWRPWLAAPGGQALISIAHVNARHPGRAADEWAVALRGVDADIIVVTECGQLARTALDEQWREAGREVAAQGNTLVGSRWPCVTARALPVAPPARASLFQFQRRGLLGEEPFTLVAVDLPSSWRDLRTDAIEGVARAIQSEGIVPDLIIGDFNTSPGAPRRILVPEGAEAFASAGNGIGATFPREFPLLRIDQALVVDPSRVLRCETFDPGIGAHRGQLVWLAGGENQAN